MYHSGGAKLEMAVDFPLRLEASDVCSALDAQPLDLTAIVCHFGSKANQDSSHTCTTLPILPCHCRRLQFTKITNFTNFTLSLPSPTVHQNN